MLKELAIEAVDMLVGDESQRESSRGYLLALQNGFRGLLETGIIQRPAVGISNAYTDHDAIIGDVRVPHFYAIARRKFPSG
jgi:hypothetical protein